MIDRCRATATAAEVRVELVEGSMTNVRLGRRYDLVFCASISMLLTRARQLDALRTIRAHLATDGRAVVDTHNPAAAQTGGRADAVPFVIVRTGGYDDTVPVEELFASRREPMNDGDRPRRGTGEAAPSVRQKEEIR